MSKRRRCCIAFGLYVKTIPAGWFRERNTGSIQDRTNAKRHMNKLGRALPGDGAILCYREKFKFGIPGEKRKTEGYFFVNENEKNKKSGGKAAAG